MPTFDGSGRMTAQAWIHKLDTFLALRPMTEIEYHDFMDRLVERFDKKDKEVYF